MLMYGDAGYPQISLGAELQIILCNPKTSLARAHRINLLTYHEAQLLQRNTVMLFLRNIIHCT